MQLLSIRDFSGEIFNSGDPSRKKNLFYIMDPFDLIVQLLSIRDFSQQSFNSGGPSQEKLLMQSDKAPTGARISGGAGMYTLQVGPFFSRVDFFAHFLFFLRFACILTLSMTLNWLPVHQKHK